MTTVMRRSLYTGGDHSAGRCFIASRQTVSARNRDGHPGGEFQVSPWKKPIPMSMPIPIPIDLTAEGYNAIIPVYNSDNGGELDSTGVKRQ